MKNDYFSNNSWDYRQIRLEAQDPPLTFIIANCDMFFFKKDIVKQVNNRVGI